MSLFTYSEAAQIGLRTAFSLIVAVNLVGNSSVCLVVWRNRRMRTAMNFLLINLACADMMVAVFIGPQYIFLHTFNHPNGLTGEYLCKLCTGGNLMWTGGVVSVVSLIGVAFERYFAVLYPHDENRRISKKNSNLSSQLVGYFPSAGIFPCFCSLNTTRV